MTLERLLNLSKLACSLRMGWHRDVGMSNIAGQKESRRGNWELWEQRLNLPLVEGVGLTSVNNSDNHYIFHRHLPLAEKSASIRSISTKLQRQCGLSMSAAIIGFNPLSRTL